MMRALFAALIICVLAVPARASWLIPHVAPGHHAAAQHHHYAARRHVKRYDAHVRAGNLSFGYARRSTPLSDVLSAACRIARALGGPCGCFASEYFFGHSVRRLWLANAWLAFPHVAAAPGTAAVWPNRHVAPVLAADGDGTVMVRDSWAIHRVRVAGLVFVDPHGGLRLIRVRRRHASA
jgi:hypothetical protein